MPHLSSQPAGFRDAQRPASRSRRALLRAGIGIGLALVIRGTARPMSAHAAVAVRVAAPQIARVDDCHANVSVALYLSNGTSAHRYLLYGDILEADAGMEEADYCCTLQAQHADLAPEQTRLLTLTQQAMAVDLGLVRGMGPAENETFSPDLVELFARIWLRNLVTDEVLGPWDSPQRVAISRSLPGWMPSGNLLGNPLMTPRGPASAHFTGSDGRPMPPLPCAS